MQVCLVSVWGGGVRVCCRGVCIWPVLAARFVICRESIALWQPSTLDKNYRCADGMMSLDTLATPRPQSSFLAA